MKHNRVSGEFELDEFHIAVQIHNRGIAGGGNGSFAKNKEVAGGRGAAQWSALENLERKELMIGIPVRTGDPGLPDRRTSKCQNPVVFQESDNRNRHQLFFVERLQDFVVSTPGGGTLNTALLPQTVQDVFHR